MHLMYYLDENNKRVYTLKKVDINGVPCNSAHPGITFIYTYKQLNDFLLHF